jgi:hypothetical protein
MLIVQILRESGVGELGLGYEGSWAQVAWEVGFRAWLVGGCWSADVVHSIVNAAGLQRFGSVVHELL